jgi:hypothetical protein
VPASEKGIIPKAIFHTPTPIPQTRNDSPIVPESRIKPHFQKTNPHSWNDATSFLSFYYTFDTVTFIICSKTRKYGKAYPKNQSGSFPI